jgi:hypothetical protein
MKLPPDLGEVFYAILVETLFMSDAVPQIPECQVLYAEVWTKFIALEMYTEGR